MMVEHGQVVIDMDAFPPEIRATPKRNKQRDSADGRACEDYKVSQPLLGICEL